MEVATVSVAILLLRYWYGFDADAAMCVRDMY